MRTPTLPSPNAQRQRLVLSGRVQGLGVRPAVARLAQQHGLAGHVCNTADGVEIVVQGGADRVKQFRQALTTCWFAAEGVAEIENRPTDDAPPGAFRIEASHTDGVLAVHVPPDIVVCAECLADALADANRRTEYAFTSCAACGPRYSLLERMPYDRAATAMRQFDLCPACRREYDEPNDRRAHAQTNACPACGPTVCLRTNGAAPQEATDADPLAAAVAMLQAGKVLAVRGVGGYQLLCDATSAAAVASLRQRKRRRMKPLALMVGALADAERLARPTDAERAALAGPAGPIVVFDRCPDAGVADNVAPGMDSLGVMLPTSPLHAMLCRGAARPLVVSSGNIEGEPLAYCGEDEGQVSALADAVLDHDRAIVRPVDDSLVRVIADRPVTLRLGRGLAPLALDIDIARPLVALGGQQKAALALANGRQAVLGPHLGELDDLATRQRYVEQYRALVDLYGPEPRATAHDLHPDYFTTRLAEERSGEGAGATPTVAVQHHHAHVAAGMIEHGWLDRKVLGVAWDGTGYGPDGAIWGGEFLLATVAGFRRVAHLRPFPLPGGETAIRQPWRIAVALAVEADGPAAALRLQFPGVPQTMIEQVVRLAQRPALCPETTSAGRLFDAAAALLLDHVKSDYEGQGAQRLEAAADTHATGGLDLPLVDGVLDWRPLVSQLLLARDRQANASAAAMQFHRGMAQAVVAVCRLSADTPVVLGGGVFQNRRLVEAICDAWRGPQPLGLPGRIPPGDGGLAAGQLAVAAATLGWLRIGGRNARSLLGETVPCV